MHAPQIVHHSLSKRLASHIDMFNGRRDVCDRQQGRNAREERELHATDLFAQQSLSVLEQHTLPAEDLCRHKTWQVRSRCMQRQRFNAAGRAPRWY